MHKENFIERNKDFFNFATELLTQENSKFNAVEALHSYFWNNKSMPENQKELQVLQQRIRKNLIEKDEEALIQTCLDIAEWGGIRNVRIEKDIIEKLTMRKQYFESDIDLDDRTISLSRIKNCSSYSKIYSLLCDDFIIYDSRVSSAICSIIIKYCEYNNLDKIPQDLEFRLIKNKGKRDRNPSTEKYSFNFALSYRQINISNIKANWLVVELAKNIGMTPRELEAALFMIGK